jgi:hypothetical protein
MAIGISFLDILAKNSFVAREVSGADAWRPGYPLANSVINTTFLDCIFFKPGLLHERVFVSILRVPTKTVVKIGCETDQSVSGRQAEALGQGEKPQAFCA